MATKTELIREAAEEAGVTQATAASVIDAFLDCCRRELACGGSVEIRDFGSFFPKATAERSGRNPQTGEPVRIAAGTTLKFRPSAALKQAVKATPHRRAV